MPDALGTRALGAPTPGARELGVRARSRAGECFSFTLNYHQGPRFPFASDVITASDVSQLRLEMKKDPGNQETHR